MEKKINEMYKFLVYLYCKLFNKYLINRFFTIIKRKLCDASSIKEEIFHYFL